VLGIPTPAPSEAAMSDYLPVIARAFALADSGKYETLAEVRAKLKSERYSDEQFLGSASLRKQVAARIAAAKGRPKTSLSEKS
jgi:hypothetical protein